MVIPSANTPIHQYITVLLAGSPSHSDVHHWRHFDLVCFEAFKKKIAKTLPTVEFCFGHNSPPPLFAPLTPLTILAQGRVPQIPNMLSVVAVRDVVHLARWHHRKIRHARRRSLRCATVNPLERSSTQLCPEKAIEPSELLQPCKPWDCQSVSIAISSKKTRQAQRLA